jgi:hypothetical protein
MALRGVKVTEEVWLTCLTHALSTETEEIMGLLLGDIQVCGRRVLALFFLHCRCLLPAVCISIVWTRLFKAHYRCMLRVFTEFKGTRPLVLFFSPCGLWVSVLMFRFAGRFGALVHLPIEAWFLGFGAHYL